MNQQVDSRIILLVVDDDAKLFGIIQQVKLICGGYVVRDAIDHRSGT